MLQLMLDPQLGIGSSIVARVLPNSALGSSIVPSCLPVKTNAGNTSFLKWPLNRQISDNCFAKSTGKQPHKGSCPQEALILCHVTVLGSPVVSN